MFLFNEIYDNDISHRKQLMIFSFHALGLLFCILNKLLTNIIDFKFCHLFKITGNNALVTQQLSGVIALLFVIVNRKRESNRAIDKWSNRAMEK